MHERLLVTHVTLCCCWCVPCRDLPRGLQLVGQAITALAKQTEINPAGSVLHVAVCNGSDALAVTDGAAKLLASGADLLGAPADDQFSSMELLGSDGPQTSTTPKQIAQVRAELAAGGAATSDTLINTQYACNYALL